MRIRRLAAVCALALAACAGLSARNIGQWNGASYSPDSKLLTWNYDTPGPTYSLTQIKALVQAAGHTVGPDIDISAANLASYDTFVIRLPRLAPDAAQLAALEAWVRAGGLLMVFADSSANATYINGILSGIHTGLSVGGSMDQNSYLISGSFLVTGPSYNLADFFLSNTPGLRVSGGTALTRGGAGWTPTQQADAAAYIHEEALGSGHVVVFGDVADVNYFEPSVSNAHGRLMLNAAAWVNPALGGGAPTPTPTPVPTPTPTPVSGVTPTPTTTPATPQTPVPPSLWLMATGLGAAGLNQLRRRRK